MFGKNTSSRKIRALPTVPRRASRRAWALPAVNPRLGGPRRPIHRRKGHDLSKAAARPTDGKPSIHRDLGICNSERLLSVGQPSAVRGRSLFVCDQARRRAQLALSICGPSPSFGAPGRHAIHHATSYNPSRNCRSGYSVTLMRVSIIERIESARGGADARPQSRPLSVSPREWTGGAECPRMKPLTN